MWNHLLFAAVVAAANGAADDVSSFLLVVDLDDGGLLVVAGEELHLHLAGVGHGLVDHLKAGVDLFPGLLRFLLLLLFVQDCYHRGQV